MSTLIATDDLQPDLFVTVHSHIERPWPARPRRVRRFDDSNDERPMPTMPPPPPVPDRSCYGVPLRIAAVNLPYVYCMVIEPGGGENGPSILDVRQVRFMRMAPETVAMIVSLGQPDEASVELPDAVRVVCGTTDSAPESGRDDASNDQCPPKDGGVDDAVLGILSELMEIGGPCAPDTPSATDAPDLSDGPEAPDDPVADPGDGDGDGDGDGEAEGPDGTAS